MAYQKGSGVIEKMARNQKAFKLEGSDDWYSVFKAVQMNGAKEGDSVAFDYEEKPKGGQVFRNIQGNVQITGAAPTSSTPGGGTTTTKDRTITRLSLLKTAGDLVAAAGNASNIEDAVQDTIAIAEQLEEWVYSEREE